MAETAAMWAFASERLRYAGGEVCQGQGHAPKVNFLTLLVEMFFSDDGMNAEEKTDVDIFTDTETTFGDGTEVTSADEDITDTEIVFVNPLYDDVITVDDLVNSEETLDAEEFSDFFVSINYFQPLF